MKLSCFRIFEFRTSLGASVLPLSNIITHSVIVSNSINIGLFNFYQLVSNSILLQKSFAQLPFISLYFKLFKIPVESRKMIESSSNIQILYSVPIPLVSVKDQ